jgi:carboxylesterase type B
MTATILDPAAAVRSRREPSDPAMIWIAGGTFRMGSDVITQGLARTGIR